MVATLDICGLKVHHPLQKHLVVSLTTFTIFFTAFLLFLLVGLSLTIIPSIYIIEVSALSTVNPVSNAATGLQFGVWGVCATRRAVIHVPTCWVLIHFRSAFDSQGSCYGPQLGYTIPTSLLSAVGLSTDLADVAETGLLLVLSLHLVAAALSTVTFVLSLFLHSHAVAILTLIIAIVAAIVGSVVFAADVALVVAVQANINSLFSDASFSVKFGNGVWMILAAMVLTWVAVVVLSARACYCCGVRRYVFERWSVCE